jgi:hypothetical protein
MYIERTLPNSNIKHREYRSSYEFERNANSSVAHDKLLQPSSVDTVLLHTIII